MKSGYQMEHDDPINKQVYLRMKAERLAGLMALGWAITAGMLIAVCITWAVRG